MRKQKSLAALRGLFRRGKDPEQEMCEILQDEPLPREKPTRVSQALALKLRAKIERRRKALSPCTAVIYAVLMALMLTGKCRPA